MEGRKFGKVEISKLVKYTVYNLKIYYTLIPAEKAVLKIL